MPVPPPHQGEVAGIVSRGLAALVDVAVVGLGVAGIYLAWAGLVFAWSPLSFQWPRPGFGTLLVIAAGLAVVYQTAGWATTGRTYGTAVLGLRVVARSGRHLRWSGAFLRALFCTLVPIGLALVACSDETVPPAEVNAPPAMSCHEASDSTSTPPPQRFARM